MWMCTSVVLLHFNCVVINIRHCKVSMSLDRFENIGYTMSLDKPEITVGYHVAGQTRKPLGTMSLDKPETILLGTMSLDKTLDVDVYDNVGQS